MTHCNRKPFTIFKLISLLPAMAFFVMGSAVQAEEPVAEEILAALRYSQTLQHHTLQGSLRQDSAIYPFTLQLDGPLITYKFRDTGESIRLYLGQKSSRLETLQGETPGAFDPKALARKVRDTDLTYEDLSMRFLYWPHAEIVGEERVKNILCYKLWVAAPAQQSTYGGVYLWTPKAGPGLLKAEVYNRQSELIKKFTVLSTQKIDGRWSLKTMRILKFDPDSQNVVSRTYLNLEEA